MRDNTVHTPVFMNYADEFIARSRHFLTCEYPAKIKLCVDALPAEALWHRLDDQSNSIGNLLLHLQGNVRQWIVSSVGGRPDSRRRAEEFQARDGQDAPALFAALRATLDEAGDVIRALTSESLATRRVIQGRDVSVFDAVYHVVEHFSMHTGQIILLAKFHAPGRIHFYDDAAGLAIPRWQRDASSQ